MSADFRANLREGRHLRELAGRAHQDGIENPKPVFLQARLLPERTARGHVGSLAETSSCKNRAVKQKECH